MDNSYYKIEKWSNLEDYIKKLTGFNIFDLLGVLTRLSIKNAKMISELPETQKQVFDIDEVLSIVNLKKYLKGQIFIYQDDICSFKKILFSMDSKDVEYFIRNFSNKYKYSFFSCDEAFIVPDENKILLFHHEGYWFSIDLPIEINDE
ncbi:hypothetical protein [Bartonella sp. HY406]|uniref:hypothetical protein n=1 Tax=Bartonella sp. HY406 TaxID=2979331 RepID=UPI0021CAD03B|nr:hypothetical protein [Bartonella sp. HY406]UXN02396.1 hypothetical protein N6B01_07775 [Bartonella sp. HY406]